MLRKNVWKRILKKFLAKKRNLMRGTSNYKIIIDNMFDSFFVEIFFINIVFLPIPFIKE